MRNQIFKWIFLLVFPILALSFFWYALGPAIDYIQNSISSNLLFEFVFKLILYFIYFIPIWIFYFKILSLLRSLTEK